MQILGLSPSTPRTENRLKMLFWPSVQSSSDVEVITQQGFWVCMIVAGMTLFFSLLQGMYIAGILEFVFFFMGGIGVRCRSRFAATAVFLLYFLSTLALFGALLHPLGIVRVVFLALLLANVRATWLSVRLPLAASQSAAVPNRTFWEKFSDRFPALVWPELRWVFYIFSVPWLALNLFGLIMILRRRG